MQRGLVFPLGGAAWELAGRDTKRRGPKGGMGMTDSKPEIISECGNDNGEIFNVPFMPSFCPNCGAKVVDDA